VGKQVLQEVVLDGLGVEADPNCLRRGVTTAVDAGSAGASTFPAFHRYIIEVAATRVVAMLNISTIGMARDDGGEEAIGELEELRWANVDRAIEVARAYAGAIVGIKVRLGPGQVGPDPAQCREALRRAQQAADAIGKPTMVHIGATTVPLDEILGALKRGDIITHCYHGRDQGILDERGQVRPAVRQAVERGINFDVGHGAGSFNWGVARQALEQGLLPGTISSDIHTWNIAGPVYDLATTASKFLHLGVPLLEVLRRIRADERTELLPVVILTSSNEDQDRINGYKLGANSYIRKPVDFDQFLEAVRQLGLYWLVLNEAPTR
jgi:dihydroorotase